MSELSADEFAGLVARLLVASDDVVNKFGEVVEWGDEVVMQALWPSVLALNVAGRPLRDVGRTGL